MTLVEFLGAVLGLFVALIGFVAALVLGYGFWMAFGVLVAGVVVGWALGVAVAGPLEKAITRRESRRREK